MMDVIIGLVIAIVALVGSWIIGRVVDRNHLDLLDEQEAALAHVALSQVKSYPGHLHGSAAPQLVMGESVLAVDYFKSFLAGLRNIFGGEVRGLQRLLERARRQATVRMMQDAERRGFNAVCNVRYSTVNIGGMEKKKGNMATVLATGTAYNARVA